MSEPRPPDDPVPNLRGPSLLTKIGVFIGGAFLGGLPFACVETILEQAGRHVGPAYQSVYFPMSVFGGWLALRLLNRRR
jgi:hypothetical protein